MEQKESILWKLIYVDRPRLQSTNQDGKVALSFPPRASSLLIGNYN